MEFDIKKESFSNENFDVKTFLNNCLKPNADNESEIFNFKLKIIQREFMNEIDLNTNNLIKSSKTLEDDLKNINLLNNNLKFKLEDIIKNKIETKQLEEMEKIYTIKKKNDNLEKAISFLEKNNK